MRFSSIHLLLGLKCFVPYKHLWALFIYGAGSLPKQVGSRNDRLHGILFLLFFLIIFSLVIQLECALTSLSMFFLYNSCFFLFFFIINDKLINEDQTYLF